MAYDETGPEGELIGFPVRRAKEDSVPVARRGELREVQERTRTEIERFRPRGAAAEVAANFNCDLHSSKAREERLGIKGGHG